MRLLSLPALNSLRLKTLIMSDNYSEAKNKDVIVEIERKEVAVEIFSAGSAEIERVFLRSQMCKHLVAVLP